MSSYMADKTDEQKKADENVAEAKVDQAEANLDAEENNLEKVEEENAE